MSVLIGSSLRHLERVLKKIKDEIIRFNPTIPGFIEYTLVKIVYIGNRIQAFIVYLVRVFAKIINMLQISMIDSMIVASLWYGFLTILLSMIVLILYLRR